PIWLYRIRAGALLGGRVLMLEHIGRTSGARRYVVLEIVDRPSPEHIVVASGFGTKAQWYRNILADPHVRVWLSAAAGLRADAGSTSAADARPRPPAAET
ncbi:nitroreductase family deazaflavin-dependent oxidoreductase, partial [Mycolicibacterium farcinogenes]|nr:nitroreductase family deazaflavin-dependent oxidoreductase [Mycolicibacterium farcinogenes]